MSIFGGVLGLDAFARKDVFDSAAGDAAAHLAETLPAVDERALLADIQTIRGLALSVVLMTADAIVDGTIPDDEIPSEFMDIQILEGLGLSEDEELDPILNQLITANIMDALSSFNVPEEVIADIFGEDSEAADAALEVAADTIVANLPDEGEPLDTFMNEFIYGFDSSDVLDEGDDVEEFDAVGKKKLAVGRKTVKEVNGRKIRYKAVRVVRHGKITVINKRLAGQKLRLTAKQKQGMKKMNVKSHSYGAISRRLRSLTKGVKHNIYKGKRAAHAARAMKAANTGLNRYFGDS